MENLNAEQVKKGLECCLTTSEGDCIACGYRGKKDGLFVTCTNYLMADALALINKQETEYNELYELCESYRIENERLFARNLDLAEKGEKVVIAYKELSKENERLMEELEKALKVNFYCSFTKSKIQNCPIDDEVAKAKADTVRKMQERLKEAPIKVGLPLFGLQTKDEVEDYANELILQMRDAIDQIAKEMLEGG